MATVHILTVNGTFVDDEVYVSRGVAHDILRGSSVYSNMLQLEVIGLPGNQRLPEDITTLYMASKDVSEKDDKGRAWYRCYADKESAENAVGDSGSVKEVKVNHLHEADEPWPRLLIMKRRGDPRISARVLYSADSNGTYNPGRVGLMARSDSIKEPGTYWLQESEAVQGVTRLVECTPCVTAASFPAVQEWAWSAVDPLSDMVKIESRKRGVYYAVLIQGSWYVLLSVPDEEYNIDVVTPVLDPTVVSDIKRKYAVWNSPAGSMVKSQGFNIALSHSVLEWMFGPSPYIASFPRNSKVVWHTVRSLDGLPAVLQRAIECGLVQYQYTFLGGTKYFAFQPDYMKSSYLGLFTLNELLEAGRYMKEKNKHTTQDIMEYLRTQAAEKYRQELIEDGVISDDEEVTEDAGQNSSTSVAEETGSSDANAENSESLEESASEGG